MGSIKKYTGSNIGGINKIIYAYAEDIDLISYNENDLLAVISLKSGKSWNFLYGTEDTITISGEEEDTDAGIKYKYKIELLIPKDRPEVEIELFGLNDHGIIIKAMDKNGTCRLFGSIDNPMFKLGKLLWPGQVEGYNGYKLTLYAEFDQPAYYITGENQSDFIEEILPGGEPA
jgi:hypothetical protein